MSSNGPSKIRHRHLDRFRQKVWAVPAWLWLCVLHRGAGKASRRRHLPVR